MYILIQISLKFVAKFFIHSLSSLFEKQLINAWDIVKHFCIEYQYTFAKMCW